MAKKTTTPSTPPISYKGTEILFKDIKFDFIKEYCVAENQVAWLKEIASKRFPVKKDGKPVIENGEVVTRKITFVELKLEFVRKFFEESAPQKMDKNPKIDMFTQIDAL